jgi:hypothetical protein
MTFDSRFGTVKAVNEPHLKLAGLPIEIQETISQQQYLSPSMQTQLEAHSKGTFKRNRNTDHLGIARSEQPSSLLHGGEVQAYQTFQEGMGPFESSIKE